MAASTSGTGVGVTFAIFVGLAIIIFLVFSWLRLTSSFRRFYAPKRFDRSVQCKPRRLPPSFLAWWWQIYMAPEEEVLRVAGLDMAIFVRLITFSAEVFTYISMWVLVVVLPTNLSGSNIKRLIDEVDLSLSPPPPTPPFAPAAPNTVIPNCNTGTINIVPRDVSAFDRCSISNLSPGTDKFWVHTVSVYVLTFIVLRVMWKYNHEASLLRVLFLSRTPRGGPSHTVLITDIPGMEYGTLRSVVRKIIGSSLFIMLPKSVKERALNFFESGVGKVRKALDTDKITKRIDLRREDEEELVHIQLSKIQQEHLIINKPKGHEASSSGPDFASASPSPANLVLPDLDKPPPKITSYENQALMAEEELNVWKRAERELEEIEDDKEQDERLKSFLVKEFDFVYGPGHVAAVNPVWDQSRLDKLVNEFKHHKTNLEDYLDKVAYKLRRRKAITNQKQIRVFGPAMGNWGKERYGMSFAKVQAIPFWTERLRELERLIVEEQRAALTKPIPSAFVTFNSRATQVRAASSLHSHDESVWVISGAPSPGEVIWSSLTLRAWQRGLLSGVLWAVFVALLIAFLFPAVLVQGIANIKSLSTSAAFGALTNIWKSPVGYEVIQGIVSPLLLLLFLFLIPRLLHILVRLLGVRSVSEVDLTVIVLFYIFQVVVVFFWNMLAGSFIDQWQYIINNPASLVNSLGISIPQTATFFITYIVVAGIGKESVQFLRIIDLLVFWVRSMTASTPRARSRLWAEQYQLMGNMLPYFTMAFFIGMVYCIINPIIAPTILLYFLLAMGTQRYNALYVFKNSYESGGRFWGAVFHQLMVGLYGMQIFIIFLLSIKGFPYTPIMIPTILFSVIFHVYVWVAFHRPWNMISVYDAAMLDKKDQAERGSVKMSSKELQDIKDQYLSPVFKIQAGDVEELLREALITRRRIDGESVEDIEQQLEREGYESCEEADDDDVQAAISAVAASEGSSGHHQQTLNGSSKRSNAPSSSILGWFKRPAAQQATHHSGESASIN